MKTKQNKEQMYVIRMFVEQNSYCPKSHLLGCDFTFGNSRYGIRRANPQPLEYANDDMYDIACHQFEADWDAHVCTKSWSLICANVARIARAYTAYTDSEGCRHFHDDDVEGFDVVPVIYDEDGEIDWRATAHQ